MKSDFLEKTLENMIFNNPVQIEERDFPYLLKNTLSQFILPSKRKIDLFSFTISDSSICCRVFELKKQEIGIASLFQLLAYKNELYNLLQPQFRDVSIEGFLVGNKISPELLVLKDNLINIDLYTYSYDHDGVHLKREPVLFGYDINDQTKFSKPTGISISFHKQLLQINYPTLKEEIEGNF